MKKLIKIQFFVLFAGTIFAWGNFFVEFNDWIHERVCTTGCAVGLVNPFLTPCFYGAIVFLIAFILSVLMVKESRKN